MNERTNAAGCVVVCLIDGTASKFVCCRSSFVVRSLVCCLLSFVRSCGRCRSFVLSLVCSVLSFVGTFVGSLVRWFVGSLVRWFVGLLVVHSFVCCLALSLRSLVRSFFVARPFGWTYLVCPCFDNASVCAVRLDIAKLWRDDVPCPVASMQFVTFAPHNFTTVFDLPGNTTTASKSSKCHVARGDTVSCCNILSNNEQIAHGILAKIQGRPGDSLAVCEHAPREASVRHTELNVLLAQYG